MADTNTSNRADVTPIKVTRSAPAKVKLKRPSSKFETQALVRQLELAVAQSATINDLFACITKIVCDESECLAMWASQPDQQGEFSQVHALTDENANALWETLATTGHQLIANVQKSRYISSFSLPFQSPTQLVAIPVSSSHDAQGQVGLVLLGCFSSENHSVLRLQWLMGMAGQAVQNWLQGRKIHQVELKQRSLVDALSMIQALDQTTDDAQTAMVVVNQVRRLCQAAQVALTLEGRLVAISDVEAVAANSEANKIVELACNQAVEEGAPVMLIAHQEQPSPSQLALENYCRSSRVEACINFPLTTEGGKTIGGLLIGTTTERLSDEHMVEYIGQLARMITGHLDVVLRANRGVSAIVRSRVEKIRTSRWSKFVLPVVLGLVALMVAPLPYRVGCDCELQPVLRRFVAAPYDGILERTLVENGDIVTEGQLLAQMDGRSLRIELSGLEAELARARKRSASALADGEIAKSQIARSEMERLEAKIGLLNERAANLDVRSPIDGIVVSGDLDKVEGAPLEMGKTLFEVAPLEQMVSEILIPESEIQYVRPGMQVAIKLSAFPFETWDGTITQIHTRAEIVEDASVFVAEVVLPNDGVDLRPGMKGSAKIKSDWAPIGWNLFHKPWEAVRYWTIW